MGGLFSDEIRSSSATLFISDDDGVAEGKKRKLDTGDAFFLKYFLSAVALGTGRSRATLIATKTFLLPFFHEPSTPSSYLVLSPSIVASAIYGGRCCIARYRLITARIKEFIDIVLRRVAPYRVASCTREA